MRIKKNILCNHEVEFNIIHEDIEVIYLAMQPGDLGSWLKQLNDVAIFLRGSPVKVLNQLSSAQAHAISDALTEIAVRILNECNGGRGLGRKESEELQGNNSNQ